MNRVRFAALAAAICCFTPLAYAQATRTWVSGVGDDVNPCSRTAPCKTFAGAISKTAVAGEINTLDPGGFGALTITKSITIDGLSGLSGVLVSGTNAFLVSAGNADVVVLRNLDIDGVGTGINGIRIISAGVVRIENCKIYGFTNHAITDERTSGQLVVTDTVASNNTQTAITVWPASASTLTASFDRVRMEGNANSGFGAFQGVKVTITGSTASGNANFGFYADTGSVLNLIDCVSFGNPTGIHSETGATIRISNTTVTANGVGLSASGGSILSYGTNRIDGNGSGNGPPTGGLAQQ